MTTPEREKKTGPRRKPRRRHGLGADGIEAIVARQDGRCAICRKPETDAPGARLAVDHDHAHCPGKRGCPDCVRGLLCVYCNNLLRSARDDRRILLAAAEYVRKSARKPRSVEDMPVAELLSRLVPPRDPRLMPRVGRRDRFFMMLLEAPEAPATVAEAGWMMDNDPQGYRQAIERADALYGGPGALDAHLARIRPPTPDDPHGRVFLQEVAAERAALGMSSPGLARDPITLGDLNAYLRSKAAKASSPPQRPPVGEAG